MKTIAPTPPNPTPFKLALQLGSDCPLATRDSLPLKNPVSLIDIVSLCVSSRESVPVALRDRLSSSGRSMTSDKIESYSPLSPAIRRVAGAFRVVGTISFWVQIVLAVVSTLVLIFSTTTISLRAGTGNPGTGAGLLFAVFGVLVLFVGAYWAFRYTQIGKQLRGDARTRPKRGDAIQALRLGIAINLVGLLLTLLGAQATVGVLLAKSLSQPQGTAIFDPSQVTRLIQPLDIFVVQANINTISAHFVGVVGSLWLARSMSRQ